jgi:tetratricopeptide (TPR) repeat protein
MSKHLAGLAAALLAVTALLASGEEPEPPATAPLLEQTPEQQAAEHYNRGLVYRDKAWKLEQELSGAPTDAAREKLGKKIAKQYHAAIDEFVAAVQKNPQLHKAWSELGYALRKSGRHQDALDSYAEALRLEPSYTPAIEYRAEALLALNQVDEAKRAYMQLFTSDRKRADELMRAMQQWIEERRANPSGVESAVIDSFARWVEERAEIAGQTTPVSQLQERGW